MAKDDREEVAAELMSARIEAINGMLDRLSRLTVYRGKLTPKQIAEGMNAASRNALRLLRDAEILFEAKRFPGAVAAAILAIEEAGKMPVLRALATVEEAQDLKETWKSFQSHQVKNMMWLMPMYVMAGVRTLAGFKPLFDPQSKHPRVLDQLKQLCFYTDCLGNGEWSEPDEFVDELIAAFILKAARALTKERTITEREIELWIQYVGPNLANASHEDLRRFWAAMQEEGLQTEHIDNIDSFLETTPDTE